MNILLRLLALAITVALFNSSIFSGWFVLWGLSTVLLGHVLVALFGTDRRGTRFPSGGDL